MRKLRIPLVGAVTGLFACLCCRTTSPVHPSGEPGSADQPVIVEISANQGGYPGSNVDLYVRVQADQPFGVAWEQLEGPEVDIKPLLRNEDQSLLAGAHFRVPDSIDRRTKLLFSATVFTRTGVSTTRIVSCEVGPTPFLTVSSDCSPNPGHPGDLVTFTWTIRNVSKTLTASGLALRCLFPQKYLAFVSASPPGALGAAVEIAGVAYRPIDWILPALAPGASRQMVFVLSVRTVADAPPELQVNLMSEVVCAETDAMVGATENLTIRTGETP